MNIFKHLASNLPIWLLCPLFLQWGMTSCNNVGNANAPLEIYEYQDSVKILPSPKSKNPEELTNGIINLALGKIQNYEGKDKIEKNLLSQIATYNSALLHGDKQNCEKYLYKDAIVYFRKYYQGLSDVAITDNIFKSISQSYIEQYKRFGERGIALSIVIPNLTRKIKKGDNIYIVFNITSNVCSTSLYTHFADFDQTLGISHNGGKNWYFVTLNNDTPNILRINNSEDIIDAVMGY